MLICQCLQSLSFTLLLQHFYSFFSSFLLKALLATQLSTSHVINFGYSGEICPPGFCLAEPQVHRGQPCCLSFSHHCRFALHTFLAQLSNKPFLSSLIFSCIASIASCILSPLLTLVFPPGSLWGVGRKRGSETPVKISYFSRLCCHIPTAGGLSFLGFTPCPRPRVRGPAHHLLLRVGLLPGSFHGVGEKTASRAVSFLVLFCLLFSTVFAQALAAQHTHLEPRIFVCFCPFNSGNFGYLSCLCCTHPFEGENPKIHLFSGLRAQPRKKRMASELSAAIGGQHGTIFAHLLLLLY